MYNIESTVPICSLNTPASGVLVTSATYIDGRTDGWMVERMDGWMDALLFNSKKACFSEISQKIRNIFFSC